MDHSQSFSRQHKPLLAVQDAGHCILADRPLPLSVHIVLLSRVTTVWAQLHVEMPWLTLGLSRKQSSCIVGPQFFEMMCF